MTDAATGPRAAPRQARNPWPVRLALSPRVQRLMARLPLARRLVRSEGEALFDLVAGFCHSQVLMALVTTGIIDRLEKGPASRSDLGQESGIPMDRIDPLLNAGAALGLLAPCAAGWRLTTRGAVLATVPGLQDMIAHHAVLYRDLADPAAFFRGETETELARFWPYVFGPDGSDADAARYSRLMAESQALVAADTLDTVSLAGVGRLLDVGGGAGAFLAEVARRHSRVSLHLFDLPSVAPLARATLEAAGALDRLSITSGSFRDDPLPAGAEAISLIRVLYDHADDTVAALLAKVRSALPRGGRVIVSEPMAGSKAGDAYFALYCLAMRTGQARTQRRIGELLTEAGFDKVVLHRSRRPFVTSVVTAVNSG